MSSSSFVSCPRRGSGLFILFQLFLRDGRCAPCGVPVAIREGVRRLFAARLATGRDVRRNLMPSLPLGQPV